MNFKQSTIFSIAASLGLIIFNMLINVIESRVLGPSEIGRYQIFITTQNLFATFCALGLGQSCIYFINALKVDERKVLSTTINATIPIASFASLVLFAIIMLKPDYFGKENVWCITLFCLGTNALLLNNIFTPVLLAKMDVVKNQVVKYSTKVFTFIILLVALFIWNKLNVGFLLALSGIGSILSLSILYHYFHRRFSFQDGIDKKLFYNIVKWGVKLAGNNIASLILTSIPVYFLTWFSISEGFLNVGYYSRANSLLIIGTVIASSVGPLLYSKWSLVKGKELKLQVRRVSLLLAFVNTLLAIGLIIFAPIFIRILYGTEYQTAAPVLRLLALTMIANGAKEVSYGILSSQGSPLSIMKNLVIGIILSAILNYFIIPQFGVIGCSVVTVLVTFTTAFLLQINYTKLLKSYVLLGIIIMAVIIVFCSSRYAMMMLVISFLLFRFLSHQKVYGSEIFAISLLIIIGPILYKYILTFVDSSFYEYSQSYLSEKINGAGNDFWDSRIMSINVKPIQHMLEFEGSTFLFIGKPSAIQHSFLSHSLITTGIAGCLCYLITNIKLLNWAFQFKGKYLFLFIVTMAMFANDFITNARFIIGINSIFYCILCAIMYRYIIINENINISKRVH